MVRIHPRPQFVGKNHCAFRETNIETIADANRQHSKSRDKNYESGKSRTGRLEYAWRIFGKASSSNSEITMKELLT